MYLPWTTLRCLKLAAFLASLSAIALAQSGTFSAITLYPVPTASSFPAGITSGPDGNLWFTEVLSNQIGRITTAGAITEYPIPEPGCLPYGITTGPDGALWFACQGDHIGRITTGAVITEYPVRREALRSPSHPLPTHSGLRSKMATA